MIPAKQAMLQMALKHVHKLVTTGKNKRSIEGHAYTVANAFGKGFEHTPRSLANLYKQTYNVAEDGAAGTSITNASAAMPPTMKQVIVVDRRYRKDKSPVLRKKYRKYS